MERQGSQADALIHEIEKVIVGKREAVELVVIGMLCRGHVLIEDIPGLGKTMLARALALAVDSDFHRIQFTPDLLPADVTGTSLYQKDSGNFTFRPGPIFGNIILADEINRATPKCQSALLESMEEFQVSVNGETHKLPSPFFVIATENPIEYEGTYPLPEAQVDRFLMMVRIGYPKPEEEVVILQRQVHEHPIEQVRPAVTAAEVMAMQRAVRECHITDEMQRYVVDVVNQTRLHEAVALGASPRGSIAMMRCSQGVAFLDGRDYVVPDDIKRVAVPALAHRITIRPDHRMRGVTPVSVIQTILGAVPAPA